MPEFTKNIIAFMEEEQIRYDLVHANFFMSALVAMQLKEKLDIPYVVTYHALGKVRRIHQKEADQFPIERLKIEEDTAIHADKIIAECPQDKYDLKKLYAVDPSKMKIVPCGFCPTEFYPVNQSLARNYFGFDKNENIILQLVGEWFPEKELIL